jgi:hypothetical protein
MPLITKPSSAPRTALVYITIGALLTVWSSVWYLFSPPENRVGQLMDAGLFLSGLVLLVIGFTVGQIGRAARDAELPPKGATPLEARKEAAGAGRNTMGQPINPATQMVPPANGAVGAMPQVAQTTTTTSPNG